MNYTTKFLRKRKFLLVLPVLVTPFFTLGFWALGGGKSSTAQPLSANISTGINPELPGAILKEDDLLDKLSYYEKAATDSLKFRDLMRSDPNFESDETPDTIYSSYTKPFTGGLTMPFTSGQKHSLMNDPLSNSPDPNEARVYQKLAELDKALAQTTNAKKIDDESVSQDNKQVSEQTEGLDKMNEIIKNMPASNTSGTDPEVNQLNGMLDKILDIQHPERIREKIKENSVEFKEKAFPVMTNTSKISVSLLDTGGVTTGANESNSFYGTENTLIETPSANSIEGVVHQNQTVVNGGILKIRLLNHVYINGTLIPKDNFVFGTVALSNERLEVTITSIRHDKSLFPVKLTVFDQDGLPGIFIPGAITREVAKQSTDNAIQSVALNSLDPSLGAQAATAGIETAKSLLSKKVKLMKVQVKAGYKILLRNND